MTNDSMGMSKEAAVEAALHLLKASGLPFILAVGNDERTVVYNKTTGIDDFVYKILMIINTQNQHDRERMQKFIDQIGKVSKELTDDDLHTV